MATHWYEDAYRRVLLDMHIPDWDERFLTHFEPAAYIDAARSAQACAVTMFSNTHTGLTNYPSAAGPMHAAFKGRDILGETIALCRRHALFVTCYYCVNYVDWYWDTHPEARTVDANGESLKVLIPSTGHPRRFSVCCMNNPGYRAFAVAQLTELCQGYDFDALTLDMTFWSTVCYCACCRERYDREVGGEMPTVIDWCDPIWVGFQRRRQAWLVDFTQLCRDTVTALKPGMPVTHQSMQYTVDWLTGASLELAAAADWLSADLYRDNDSLTFYFNMFKHLSSRLPFEAISTWCYPTIFEHVITRTEDELLVTAFRPLAHHGATVFIDAVDPQGYVAERTYKRVAPIYKELARHETYATGRPCEDVAVYVSFESSIDLAENGNPVHAVVVPDRRGHSPSAHRAAALQAAKTLTQQHLPFGVITARQLDRLHDFQVVVLPNVVMLSEAEIAAFRAFVEAGGALYASKSTSLLDTDGRRRADFGLADVFGVSCQGETSEVITYLAPTPRAGTLLGEFTERYPMTLPDTQLVVQADQASEVLATITLPYTDPHATRYASMLTDPPGVPTADPALVLRRYGKGQVLYAAGTPEIGEHATQRAVFVNLLRHLIKRPLAFEAHAPKCIEITLYYDEHGKRYLINVLNVQGELPNVPVMGFPVRLRLDGKTPSSLVRIPNREPLDYAVEADAVSFLTPTVETFVMLELGVTNAVAPVALP